MLWHPDLLWFRDSPDAGARACRCSWCGEGIAAERDCVRLWYGDGDRYELRFHALCFAYVANAEGLIFDDVEDMLMHWRQHA
jgi:hypothetical protein